MAFDYESWIRQAEERLVLLRQKRAELDDEIQKLEDGITAFDPLRKRTAPPAGANLTDSIRSIFKGDPACVLTPTEVRDALLNQGIELGQANPMATIHQILKRLNENGEIQKSEGRLMKPGYRFAKDKKR